MKSIAIFLLLIVSLVYLSSGATEIGSADAKADKKVIVCYYGAWSAYRWGAGQFAIEDIDPFLCTHIVYAFATLSPNNTIQSVDPYYDLEENGGLGAYKRFVALTERNPELKALIAIGGWNDGSARYSKMAADPAQRTIFVSSVVDFLQRYGFHGLDFDWEYPAYVELGGRPEDKVNYIHVIRELKAAFSPYGYMLTAALSPGKPIIDNGYDIPAMSDILDHFHLMTYDYHGAWESYTGHNSPLYTNPSIDTGSNSYLSQDFTVNYYLQHGAPASKLVLGMAAYGRGFILNDAANSGFYATAYQPIPPGPITGDSGLWGYVETCAKLNSEDDWTIVLDKDYYQAPYAYNSKRHWIGYDDEASIKIKTSYVIANQLLGAMIWSLEMDDYRGNCTGERYPLVNTVVRTLNQKSD